MNGYVWSYLATLSFKNWEQLEYLHGIILRIQQEIILFVETVSPTRLLFQYMKEFSKSGKLKSSIAPKMIDLIAFLGNTEKSSVYTGGDIHWIYCYLDMIGAPI